MDQSLAKIYAQSELETTKRDAYSSEGRSPEERMEMFSSIMAAVEAMQSHLSDDERARRKRIRKQLEPRPEPWWRNIRKDALAEYQCRTSST
jgi:hypothetical protein